MRPTTIPYKSILVLTVLACFGLSSTVAGPKRHRLTTSHVSFAAKSAETPDYRRKNAGLTTKGKSNKNSNVDMPLRELIDFVRDDVNNYWQKTFAATGRTYRGPEYLHLYDKVIDTPCGKSELGNAFYCPKDRNIYADINLLDKYYREIGDFTVLLILAHEWGHLVQDQVGINKGNNLSIAVELQADCLAGAYSKNAAERGIVEEDDPDEGVDGLFQLKDPKGVPWLSSNAHGKGYQRIDNFLTGFKGGIYRCGFVGNFIGTWQADINDLGFPQRITIQFKPDGSSLTWFTSAAGTTPASSHRWRYDGGNLYMTNPFGGTEYGTVNWIDNDHVDVTIVQDLGRNSNSGRVRNLRRVR